MMPLSLFRNPVFSGVHALTFFLYAGLGAAMLFLSLNMVQIQGYSQLQAGLSFLPFTLLLVTLSGYAGGWADRHGPRVLLIAGPVIVGIGMILLSMVGQVHRLSDYWFSFFPGIVVFGLGLSLTVAPLTATVMGAASTQFSGVASGVNNALSRVAGVFANAVFGALAVVLFAGAVGRKVDGMGLDARDRREVMAETAKLGDAKVPEAVKALGFGRRWGVTVQVEAAYRQGYYRSIPGHIADNCGSGIRGGVDGYLFVKTTRVK